MFSVNMDKLVKMTDQEKNTFQDAVQSINDNSPEGIKSLAVIGGGMNSFKLAYAFSETGKKVLFIDADLDENVFLGKYKLGKNLKGFTDFIGDTGSVKGSDTEDVVCMTNHDRIQIVFTGDTKVTDKSMLNNETFASLFTTFSDYDLIVLQSDEQGMVAKQCDASVLMMDLDQYSEISAEVKVSELNKNGCYVLGVIINE